MKNIINRKKGITLIALIITIVIMLILAGVSIKVAVDDNFMGKAEEANQMNEDAIAKAEEDEENVLKQNSTNFKVDEKVDVDFIEVYGLKDDKLIHIDKSLSKYIEEEGTPVIYFKVSNSNRNTLYYDSNNNNARMANEYHDANGNVKIMEENSDEITVTGITYKKKNSILELQITNINDLKGLTIEAKKNNKSTSEILSKLTFEYNSLNGIGNTIYIPVGEENINLSLNEEGNGYHISGTSSKIHNGNTNKFSGWTSLSEVPIVGAAKKDNKVGELSEKTEINIENINLKNFKFDTKKVESTILDETDNKLYIVQEITEDYDKYVYMDDINCEVYSPIEEITFSGPSTLPLIFSHNEELKIDYKNANIFCDNCENESSEDNILKNKFEIFKENNKFYAKSNVNSMTEITSNSKYSGNIDLKISAVDYGGKIIEKELSIRVATDNFIVLSQNNAGVAYETGFYTYLSEALTDAKTRLQNGHQNVTVQQNTNGYNPFMTQTDLNSNFFSKTEEEIEVTTRDEKTIKQKIKVAYFNINSNLNGLIYDLNGNNLDLTLPGEGRMVRMKIHEGVNFTLKSSKGTEGEEWQNGEITFNVEKTFDDNFLNIFDSWNLKEFKSVFTKYSSLEEFMKSKGVKEIKLYHYLWYPAVYVNDFLSDYKAYMNTFNNIGFQNKDYKRNVDAVINEGIFNFHSGRIVLKSEEQVRAVGAWDGSVVMDIIEGFLGVLRKLNINVLKVTDWTSGYAKLEHTGAVISNYNTVNLGYGDGGVTNSRKAYPEIVINLKSTEEAWGVTMGSIFNPNRSITRAYGIWNKNSGATTTMNSGFINMIIRNETNNWVSLGVGKAYGIFNDRGTTYFNGVTSKKVNIQANYYGLGTLIDDVRVEFKSDKLQGLGKWINGLLDDLARLKDKITSNTYYGFFTFSTQKILYNFTGGATIVYTNSYAIANAENRDTFRGTDGARYKNGAEVSEGIFIGGNLQLGLAGLEEKEVDNFINLFKAGDNKKKTNEEKQHMQTLFYVPFYYMLYENDNDTKGIDYKVMTHQKIINPLHTLLEGKLDVVDGLVNSALGSMVNGLNNFAVTNWIGEDVVESQDVISTLIKVGFREIKQSLRSFITFDD